MAAAQSEPHILELPADHPGVTDLAYRARRAAIAEVAASYHLPGPIPDVEYSAEEDDVWRVVSAELAAKHRACACRAYLDSAARLVLPTDRVPQLREVDERLASLTSFHLMPVAGLVPTRQFYGGLADRIFHSTQYIRHHSVPYYTPEPDIVHEIIGHANTLAGEGFANVYEAAGRASLRATTDEALAFFSSVFWFTLEFGVLWEDEELRAYGAGLLSSFGEIDAFRSAEIRPFDLKTMGTFGYDITRYQPVLFAAESFDRLVEDLTSFFDRYDDAAYARLTAA